MSNKRDWHVEVDKQLWQFATMAEAERYGRYRIVAQEHKTGHCTPLQITYHGVLAATVRMDALGRVWTDVAASDLVS